MMSTRDLIFTQIRQSLKRPELDENARQQLESRIASPPVFERPAVGADLTTKFFYQLEKVVGTHDTISTLTDLPFAILEFLQQHQLPKELVVDRSFQPLSWPPRLSINYRAAQANDVTSITQAFAGIAETGSVVLISSPASPTTLNFLPENHLVVLKQVDLVAHIEEVWKKLRLQAMPRTVNFITGPSRTADIEQTIQLGAHGPRRLHLILVKK